MRVPQTASQPANYINHIIFVGDESSSMNRHRDAFVKAWDGTVGHLAERSKAHGQETRVSAYFFNSRSTERCEVWDKDVLRMPSVAETYRPRGMTALIDAVMLAISDLSEVSQKYGEHAFMIFALTDGEENDSRRRSDDLRRAIAGLAENVTIACFVPNQQGVFEAKAQGFPAANISVWDTTSALGVESVGEVMRDISDMFMKGREQGIKGYNSRPGGLFRMRDFSAADVTGALAPMTPGTYVLLSVPCDTPIRQFVEAAGMTYVPSDGKAFYQLTKPVKVQSYKDVIVEHEGRLYTGDEARQVLGLPGHDVTVQPAAKPGMTVFFQSTSVNRKLLGGTRLVVMR